MGEKGSEEEQWSSGVGVEKQGAEGLQPTLTIPLQQLNNNNIIHYYTNACINFHMIMHPYFSSQIAPEAISENPNSIILGSMFQRYNIRSGEIQ